MRLATLLLAILLLFVAIPTFAQSSSTPATPITLSEAIRLARANSPQTIQARGNERVSNAAVRSARAAFLPNVSVSAGASRTDGGRASAGSGADRWNYSNGFSLSTDLFNAARFSDIRAARADVLSAEATTVSQNYAVSLDVAQQYYNTLSALESQDAAQAQLAQAEQQLSVAVRRVKAGAATRSDSLRAFVQVANARVALITAQANLRAANATLTRLIASPTVVTASPNDTTYVAPITIDSAGLVALALQGPAVEQARAQQRAAQARQSSARALYLPTVGVSYSKNGSGNSGLGGNNAFNYGGQLSFSLSYPLFNQFNREEQVLRARVSRENADAALRDAELAARQISVTSLDALHTAMQRVEAARIAVVAAEEDLRVQQARYEMGLSTIVDVLTSQTQLNQARADLIAARFDARIARAQIEALIGRDLNSFSTSTQSTIR